MKRERKILPFTNRFGDVIQPGDFVYAITTCTHRTHVNKAEYVGYVERSSYDWKTKEYKDMPYVQVKSPCTIVEYFDKKANKKYDWVGYTKEYFDQNVERREIPSTRISTLQYNNILPVTAAIDQLVEAV
jgi:hypothetical protein